jgi:uncharacterized protein (TIGR02099 family)
MTRWIGGMLRWAWYGVAAVLVLAAAVVSLGQYYFPYLDDHREELLATAAADLPFGVEVAALHAEWTGLAPTFEVRGLRLFAREEPAITMLTCERSLVRIDLARSLLALSPRLRSIAAENVQLGFREAGDGRWHIDGVGAARSPANTQGILAFFLAIEEIQLSRTRLVLSPADGEPVEIERADLGLENFRHFRRLHFDTQDQGARGRLAAVIEAEGDPREREHFRARAHVRLDGAHIEWLQPLVGAPFRLPRAQMSGEVWMGVEPGGQMELRAAISAPELELAPLASGRRFAPLRSLEARLAASWVRDHGTLWVERLHGSWFGQDLALDRLRLDSEREGERWQHHLAAEYIDIGALGGALLGSGTLGDAWVQALQDFAPYGGFSNARLDLGIAPGERPVARLRTRLEDVSVSPWRDAPGIRNLRGYVDTGIDGGHVDIDSGAVTLEFPRLYRADLDLESLQGRVSWSLGTAGLEVGSERLHAVDQGAGLDALFRLKLFRDPAAEDEFSLAVGLRGGDAAMRHRYLPYTLDAKLQRWLDASVQGGRIDAGLLALRRGFGRADGVRRMDVQLALDLRDAMVDYHPDWPPLADARARVMVDGTDVRVWTDHARVFGSRVEEGMVHARLDRDMSRIAVRGRIEGDVADGLRVINESPLARMTGGALANWSGSGPMRVGLRLELPLGAVPAPGNARIEVKAALDGATLDLRDFGIRVEQLGGEIDYSLAGGLHSGALHGLLWERPAEARISPRDGDTQRIAVDVGGVAPAVELERWLGVASNGMLGGEAPFTLRLEQQDHGFTARIASSLRGVSSTLPAPLAKTPAEELPLTLELLPQTQGRVLRARLDGVGSAALDWNPSDPVRGEITLGGEARHGGEGVRLGGALTEADAGAWIVAVQHLLAANAGRGPGLGETFRIEDLRVDSALLWGTAAHGLRLDSRREDGDFVLGFAADLAAGSMRWPRASHAAMQLHLERLDLQPFLPTDAAPADAAGAPPPADEQWSAVARARIAPIDVELASARLGVRDLGRWQFRVAAEPGNLAITGAIATLPGAEITGLADGAGGELRVRWNDGMAQTELAMRVRMNDMRAFSANWGVSEVIDSHSGRVDFALGWPGSPTALAMVNATGMMDFSFRDGRLLSDVGNNPLMRAIGILSFNEVLRRLKLDFKDLYQSGLAFDRFEAVIDLGGGLARTREPIVLKGPTARMRLSGQTDLRSRIIDGDMIVTLPIGSNLPWVAVLAGGLPAAAGVYVASRLFENQLGKFSSAVYKVSGPLDEPKLEFVKVFDVEGESGKKAPPAAGTPPAVQGGASQ